MKIYCRNTLTGLIPLYPADYEEKKKMKIGEDYEVSIKLARNPLFHRKFFALLNIGWQNSPNYGHLPFEVYRKVAVMKAGYFVTYNTPKGVIFEAESIAFDKMSEDEFRGVFSNVFDWIINDTCTDKDALMEELMRFL